MSRRCRHWTQKGKPCKRRAVRFFRGRWLCRRHLLLDHVQGMQAGRAILTKLFKLLTNDEVEALIAYYQRQG